MSTIRDFIEGRGPYASTVSQDDRTWCLLHRRPEDEACVWVTPTVGDSDTVLNFDTSNDLGRAWLAGLQAGCELNEVQP